MWTPTPSYEMDEKHSHHPDQATPAIGPAWKLRLVDGSN